MKRKHRDRWICQYISISTIVAHLEIDNTSFRRGDKALTSGTSEIDDECITWSDLCLMWSINIKPPFSCIQPAASYFLCTNDTAIKKFRL